MQFTGRNLVRVRSALYGAIADCQMQIGSCPDVFTHAEEIAELEADKTEFERLLTRVDHAINVEMANA